MSLGIGGLWVMMIVSQLFTRNPIAVVPLLKSHNVLVGRLCRPTKT
jgi:hypothetical protein